MLQFRWRAALAAVVLVAAVLQAPLLAQTPAPDPSDAFFDDTVVHEIRLAINPKDWTSLKVHYLDNDYYTCDFRWNAQPTVYNIAIRSRGTGSRSGVKPGLRVDFDRNARISSWAEVVRPEQHADRRTAADRHAVLPADGAAGAARGHTAVHQRRLRRMSDRRVGGQDVPEEELQR
jgi:spore coat protein CotH